VAVVVSDASASARFYQEAFGLAPLERATEGLSGNPGAWFRLGALELHLQQRPGGPPRSDQHFALLTNHLDEIRARVERLGGRVEEGRLIPGVRKRCFAYDPDGNRIELLEH